MLCVCVLTFITMTETWIGPSSAAILEDPCLNMECLNGGTCFRRWADFAECICAEGFRGEFCEKKVSCPDGYTGRFKGSCYKCTDVSVRGLSWEDAEAACKQDGGTLAEITTKEENAYLAKFMKPIVVTGWFIWVGGRRVNGTWRWHSSGAELSYTSWIPGRPWADNSYDCVWVYPQGQSLQWYNAPCTPQRGYLCEIKLA